MTTQRSMFRFTALALAFGLAAAALPAAANVNGMLVRAGSGQELRGVIRWQPAARAYVITPQGSTVQLTLSPREVERVVVDKPRGFDAAVNLVRQGRFRDAIPALTKLVEDYQMLQWDVPAAQYLALAHLRNRDARQAVAMCERVLSTNESAARDPAFAAVYWEALLETDSLAKLRRALDDAIVQGSRELAAVAQVRRGDLARKQGNLQEALIDGYLRTVVFYQAVRSIVPEALFKAASVFEELGQSAHAERMRKRLLAEFPNDEYTARLKGGA